MADLRVELYGELVGHLVGADRRTFDFIATKNAIERFGLGSTILSESVPFDLMANRSRAARAATSSPSCFPRAPLSTISPPRSESPPMT
ncbi:hypothetical protein H4V99_002555 [Cryobacterium sp. CG_9.6]|nr:hypothetical protein [Cryobacterium sp. CG_9.6]